METGDGKKKGDNYMQDEMEATGLLALHGNKDLSSTVKERK